MKKLIFALNEFLLSFDEEDFYSCELKKGKVYLWGHFSAPLADKLVSCGLFGSNFGNERHFRAGCVYVILIKRYPTNGHVK